jgi:hypothetical protein
VGRWHNEFWGYGSCRYNLLDVLYIPASACIMLTLIEFGVNGRVNIPMNIRDSGVSLTQTRRAILLQSKATTGMRGNLILFWMKTSTSNLKLHVEASISLTLIVVISWGLASRSHKKVIITWLRNSGSYGTIVNTSSSSQISLIPYGLSRNGFLL